MFFGKKKNIEKKDFDRNIKRPVLKCSICNGEQVAGFQDIRTGRFEEVMLIASDSDMESFLSAYSLAKDEVEKIY